MLLDSQVVRDTFTKCLFKDEEIADKAVVPEGAILSRGLTMDVGFHPGRISENRALIIDMLSQLPAEFMKDSGGGMSFLNMCNDKEGRHWGEHRSMEELVHLGQAIGAVTCCVPKPMWTIFPGGMPYYIVDLTPTIH